jgi:hypothetical protein
MRLSDFFKKYSENKTHICEESYLNDDTSWSAKQLIMQLKLGVSHLTWQGKSIRIKEVEHFYKKQENDTCENCESGETEDIFHIIYECNRYTEPRSELTKALPRISEFAERNVYLKIFNHLKTEAVRSIQRFFSRALKLRELSSEQKEKLTLNPK